MQALARSSVSILLMVAMGCDGADGSADAPAVVDEVNVGIVEYYGMSDGVVEAPTSVAVGEIFTVAIYTYGEGCDAAESMESRMDPDEVLLTPYDRTYIPAVPESDPPVAEACTSRVWRLEHAIDLTFDTAGDKTLRVRGRRVAEKTDEEMELVHPLIAE